MSKNTGGASEQVTQEGWGQLQQFFSIFCVEKGRTECYRGPSKYGWPNVSHLLCSFVTPLYAVPLQLATFGQGQQAWCCDYCQKCVGCGKGNEDAFEERGTPLTCTERGKVHHAHLDAPEGSEPGPKANEKVEYRGVFGEGRRRQGVKKYIFLSIHM